jgi:peptide/nickel transport system substrate-binding protein
MNRSMRRVALAAMAAICVSFLGVACGGDSSVPSSGKTPVPGGTVTFRVAGDYRSFDVPLTSDAISQLILSNAYSTLLYLDNGGKLQGYMAKSWKATPTSVTFNLNSGMTCSDGTPVTATVVKNSFQHMIDIKAPYTTLLFGPGPYTATADDANNTFTLSVGTPFSDLVYGFTQTFPSSLSAVICPAGLKDPTQLATKMFGSGPYTMVEAVHGDHVTFKLRPEFAWGPLGTTAKTVGVPETVIIKVITNETTAANALLTGSVDVLAVYSAGVLTGPDVNRLLADRTITHYEQPTWVTRMLVFNQQPGRIGADQTVRQALITAIDPKAWLQAADSGHGRTSPSFITTDVLCFDPTTAKLAPKPDVVAARKVLTDAGWTYANGKLSKNGQPLKVTFTGSIDHNAGPEYIVNQWSQMGADATLLSLDRTSTAAAMLRGTWEAAAMQTSTPAPIMGPPAKRISGPSPPKGTNYIYSTDSYLNDEATAGEQTYGAVSCQHWANFQQQLWKKWHVMGLSAPHAENFSKNIDFSLGLFPIMTRRVK